MAAALDTVSLPTGTVTFLVTDIEGSTNLARALGDRWPDVLDEHHDILRTAIRSHGGIDISTEGDAFFAVFTSAVDAIGTCADAQRGLTDHEWPADGPVRVRMGMHSGEGRLGGGEYVGLDVHRAARIAAAGHGGQVLVSETTRSLAVDKLPDGWTLRDLGAHRLEDPDKGPPARSAIDRGTDRRGELGQQWDSAQPHDLTARISRRSELPTSRRSGPAVVTPAWPVASERL
jgi:class 3 adenylate cyclase